MRTQRKSAPSTPANNYKITDISRDPQHEIKLVIGTEYYEKGIISTFVGDSQTWDTWHVHARKAGYGRVPMQFVGNYPTKNAAIEAAVQY